MGCDIDTKIKSAERCFHHVKRIITFMAPNKLDLPLYLVCVRGKLFFENLYLAPIRYSNTAKQLFSSKVDKIPNHIEKSLAAVGIKSAPSLRTNAGHWLSLSLTTKLYRQVMTTMTPTL